MGKREGRVGDKENAWIARRNVKSLVGFFGFLCGKYFRE